jgi:hypothetical protein
MSEHEDPRPSNGAYDQSAAAIVRTGFGSHEIERRRETQATALAERAKAEVQAMYIVARQFPRTWETVWGSLTKECQRYTFADAGMYRLKKGKKKNEHTGQWEDNWIEGLTIGFARTAARTMGNLDIRETVTYEDDQKVITSVSGIDLEANVRYSRDASVSRTIERGSPDGRQVLGERKNSYGKTTYVVVPTDEEMDVKCAAKVSKKRRDVILDMLPPDLKDDCKEQIRATLAKADKADPDTSKKKLIAAYAGIGVTADALIDFLGHPLEQIHPDELEVLRGIFGAIREGETTWVEQLRERKGEAAPASEDKGGDALKAKLAKSAGKDKASVKPADAPAKSEPATEAK